MLASLSTIYQLLRLTPSRFGSPFSKGGGGIAHFVRSYNLQNGSKFEVDRLSAITQHKFKANHEKIHFQWI